MAKQPTSPNISTAVLTPAFKLVFIVNFLLTLLSLGVAIWLASVGSPNPLQTSLFETCSATWKTGMGIFLGLLGGKALS